MKPGDVVEDFELKDQDGIDRRLSSYLINGPVVLFFYPAAMSAGCTMESCHFRDMASEFAAVGAQRVGISGDTVDKQKKFSDKHSFDYPLLADTEGTVRKQFGIGGSLNPMKAGRKTFVIGQDFKVLDVISPAISMSGHADKALAFLKQRV